VIDSHKSTSEYESGLGEWFGHARIKIGNSLVLHVHIRTQTRHFALDPTRTHLTTGIAASNIRDTRAASRRSPQWYLLHIPLIPAVHLKSTRTNVSQKQVER
jgi:hypothetical protein